MPSYIEMPKLSDTMTEGTVVKWRKAVGDKIEPGTVVAEVETDKAVMELEAFEPGVLGEVYVGEGAKAKIGDRLAVLVAPGEIVPAKDAKTASPQKPSRMASAEPEKHKPTRETVPVPGTRIKASPLAKKISAANGLDLSDIKGSGPGGRIIARDLESARTNQSSPDAAGPIMESSRRIPLTGMRKIITERLLASKTQIPHFYLNIEVDAGDLLKLRARINDDLEKAGEGKLTINDFILKAAVAAAVKVPRVNASFAGDAIVEFANVHLSVAVALDEGLVTPVVRQAQKKSLREISEAVKDLAGRARSKKLKPEEFQGGTITVSNLGSYGIESFSAIINPPQAMILSVGAIVKKPVVNEHDEVVSAHRVTLGLSADHRVVDGSVGAQYLAALRRFIENPALMLI